MCLISTLFCIPRAGDLGAKFGHRLQNWLREVVISFGLDLVW